MYHFNSPRNVQHCSHVALVTCRATIAISVPPGTYLHLSEENHLGIKCLAQGHSIDTTMSQYYIYLLTDCAGDTPLEEAQVDMVKGCLEDTGKVLFAAIGTKSEAEKVYSLYFDTFNVFLLLFKASLSSSSHHPPHRPLTSINASSWLLNAFPIAI